MASNIKYLEDNGFGGFNVRITSNVMNVSLVIQNDVNMVNLVNFLISPPVLSSLFITPRDWLTSLQIFPLNINVGIDGITATPLKIGGVEAKKQGGDNNDIVNVETCYSSRVFNLGEYKITPYFNNFADYNGYTKIQIYLPMFGFVDINPNDVMNKYIQIRMSVDVVSGMAVYYIGVSEASIPLGSNGVQSDDTNINRILATYSFQIGYNIPIGSSDAPQIYRNIVGGAVKGIATAVGAYAISGLGATGGTFTTKTVKTARNPKTGRQITKGTTTKTTTYDGSNYQFGKAVTECFEYGSQALTSMHMSVQSDRVNNPAVLCEASESVHIIIQRPKIKPINDDYNHLYGQPLGEVKQLSELSGYTEITNLHLEDGGFDTATQEELLMIMQELSSGVLL